jgi:MFS transporter, DHA1 family, inner membrane transport protein
VSAATDAAPRAALPRLLVLAAALFIAGTNAFVIAGLLPDIADALGTTAGTAGLAITAYAGAVALAAPFVAIGLPRVPRATLLSAGLLVLTAGTVITIFAHDLTAFVVGRIVAGLGAAALVPTATAAAAALVAPERRGRALALVTAGFTLAFAAGSPLGTALGAALGWRAPLWAIAGLGVALALALPLLVRGVPVPGEVPLRRRFAPLASPAVLAVLGATVLVLAGFNSGYFQSAVVTDAATGGSGALLAVLLLAFGAAGVLGNVLVGPALDRFGSRVTAIGLFGTHAAALLVLAIVADVYAADVAVFAVWGLAALASSVPLQHRLVSLDPEQAQQALSWQSTAMYVGIALAPVMAASALHLAGAHAIPLAGAGAVLLALALFLLGGRSRRSRRA